MKNRPEKFIGLLFQDNAFKGDFGEISPDSYAMLVRIETTHNPAFWASKTVSQAKRDVCQRQVFEFILADRRFCAIDGSVWTRRHVSQMHGGYI